MKKYLKEQKLGITITLLVLAISLASLLVFTQQSNQFKITTENEWLEIGFASYTQTCTDKEPIMIKNNDGSTTVQGGGSCSSGIGHGWAHVSNEYIIFDSGNKVKLDEFVKTVDSYTISNCFDPNIHCFTQQWKNFKKSSNMA